MRRVKGQKIRHYRGSLDSRSSRRRSAIKWVLSLVVLFLLGYFVARPVLDAGASWWYAHREQGVQSESGGAPGSAPESVAQPEATPTPEPDPTPVPQQEGSWATVSISALANAEQAEKTARQLADRGVKYALVPLKDGTGYLYYGSRVELAARSIGATTFDAAAAAKALKDAGLVPVASIAAFRDPIAAYTDKTMAIRYEDEETVLWLDNAPTDGGKAWLNPYSAKARGYIGDLAEEAVELGFEQVLFTDVTFPLVYNTNHCNFGETGGRGFDLTLKSCIAEWQSRLAEKGAACWFEYSAAAVTGDDLRAAGAPAGSLGVENLMVRLPEETAEAAAVLEACAQAAAGSENLVLHVESGAPSEALKRAAEQAGFGGAVNG